MFAPVRIRLKSPALSQCFSAFSPEKLLSEENMTKTVEKFAKMRPAKQQTQTPTKNAAVLIPLCVINKKVSLLYTLRAPNLKTHRGQVSFPGGMQDAGEEFEETALRETEEELGLGEDKIFIWGKGNLFVSRGVTGVLPIIGQIKSRNVMKEIKMNPTEVSEVFAVPLEVLCDPNKIGHTQFRSNYSLPVFLGGRNRIWGLTAMITHLFLNALLPKTLYDHQVKYVHPARGTYRTF